MTLLECKHCGLLYRTPTDTRQTSVEFYQKDYKQGTTTDFPDDAKLSHLKKINFNNTDNSYDRYVDVLRSLGCRPGLRVFDFGCSWGYGSFQLMRAGYEVEGFEISAPRCQFAIEKLDVNATNDMRKVSDDFDVFFSAHVLEHVPNVYEIISLARRVTKPGGLFLAFTPNGSLDYRDKRWQAFHLSWGLVHPNVLQDKFYRHVFRDNPLLLASDPYPLDFLESWNHRDQVACDLSGGELLAIAEL